MLEEQVTGVKSFRDLLVWQKAMQLVTDVYQLSCCFPKEEQSGLTSQLRRAAVSVPANIAEGQARRHSREFRNFLSIALGSLAELQTHVEIGARLGYLRKAEMAPVWAQAEELAKMLHGLLRALPTSH
jgi:four helix bundle protein